MITCRRLLAANNRRWIVRICQRGSGIKCVAMRRDCQKTSFPRISQFLSWYIARCHKREKRRRLHKNEHCNATGLPTYLPAFPLAADTSIVMSLLPQKSHSSSSFSLLQIHFTTPRRYMKARWRYIFPVGISHIYEFPSLELLWVIFYLGQQKSQTYRHTCWRPNHFTVSGDSLSPFFFIYIFPCVAVRNPLSLLKRNIFHPADISFRLRLLRRRRRWTTYLFLFMPNLMEFFLRPLFLLPQRRVQYL